nr:uncharacterized protein LOC113805491 [Penaeus vannamei]
MAVALGSRGGCTGVRSLGCSARGLLAHAPDGVNYAGLTRSQRRLNVRLARSPSWRLLPRPNSDECAEEIRRVGMRRVCVQRKKVAVTISVCRECSLDVANSRPGRVSVLNAKEEKSPGEINALATSAAPGERRERAGAGGGRGSERRPACLPLFIAFPLALRVLRKKSSVLRWRGIREATQRQRGVSNILHNCCVQSFPRNFKDRKTKGCNTVYRDFPPFGASATTTRERAYKRAIKLCSGDAEIRSCEG